MTHYCKNCGAVASKGLIRCDYCNTPLEGGGVPYETFLANFNRMSQEIQNNKKTSGFFKRKDNRLNQLAALVQGIYVPFDRVTLLNLAAFTVGQIRSIGGNYSESNLEMADVVLPAWLAKSNEIALKVRMIGNDDQLDFVLAELEKASSLRSTALDIKFNKSLNEYGGSIAIFATMMLWLPLIIGLLQWIGQDSANLSITAFRIAVLLSVISLYVLFIWMIFFGLKRNVKET